MSRRYRLLPTPVQEVVLREHCAHARFVWNLAIEQHSWWRRGRPSPPGFVEQSRQLTQARAACDWLRSGSAVIQEQALRDFEYSMKSFLRGLTRKPSWRKAGRKEGFCVVGRGNNWSARRPSRHVGEVWVPKVGWVRFRWSRALPECKSYRVTLDSSGRWHVAFRTIPETVTGPGTGEVVGIDRGVTVSATLSTAEMLTVPRTGRGRAARLLRLQRKFARAKRGSNRRARVKLAIGRIKACEKDVRKDWAEKASTDIARRFDVIRVEDLRIVQMTRSARGTVENPGRNVRQKAWLNGEIQRSGWGLLVRRLEEKAPGRVEKINPRFTSQRCSACGHVDPKSRKSQALFVCTACGFALNADVNAAKNIAGGHPATARGGMGKLSRPANREPHLTRLAELDGIPA